MVCPQRIIAAAERHGSGICAGAGEDQTKRVKRRTAHARVSIIDARSALAAEVVRAKIRCVPLELLVYPVRQRVAEPDRAADTRRVCALLGDLEFLIEGALSRVPHVHGRATGNRERVTERVVGSFAPLNDLSMGVVAAAGVPGGAVIIRQMHEQKYVARRVLKGRRKYPAQLQLVVPPSGRNETLELETDLSEGDGA